MDTLPPEDGVTLYANLVEMMLLKNLL